MDKDFFNRILNSDLNDNKVKIVEELFDKALNNDFVRDSENVQNPIPKSQNHLNTINNSVQSQQAIQNMLNRLNNKKDDTNN